MNKLDGNIVAENIDSDVIKEVTNNDEIIPNWGVMRVRQASDDTLRTAVNELVKLFERQIDIMELRGSEGALEEVATAISKYNALEEDSISTYISELLALHNSNAALLTDSISSLVGHLTSTEMPVSGESHDSDANASW